MRACLRSVGRVVFGTAFLAMACSGSKPADELTGAQTPSPNDAKLLVYAVNYPLQYLAERIGGDLVRVEFPASADGDPAFWSPDPTTVGAYQKADLILLNGAGYAKWTDRVSLPPTALVNTSESFEDEYIYVENAVTHSQWSGGRPQPRRSGFYHVARSDAGYPPRRCYPPGLRLGAPRARGGISGGFCVTRARSRRARPVASRDPFRKRATASCLPPCLPVPSPALRDRSAKRPLRARRVSGREELAGPARAFGRASGKPHALGGGAARRYSQKAPGTRSR